MTDAEGAMFTIMSVIKGVKKQTNSHCSVVRAGAIVCIRCCMCSSCCDVPLFSIGLQLVYVWIALHRHETLKLWFLEAWIYSRQWFLEVIFKEGEWLLSLGNARPTNLRLKSRHLIGKLHSASRDGYAV